VAWKHVHVHASIAVKLQAAISSKKFGNFIVSHVNSNSNTAAQYCKLNNLKERSRNRADWEKAIKETKVCFGLQCHLRRIRIRINPSIGIKLILQTFVISEH
jgi:hypothetical protein